MSDRTRWDERHGVAGPNKPPVPWIADRFAERSSGRALDLACGTGRHALELASRGYEVEGWDVSPVALARLEAYAREEELTIRTREVDLSADGLPEDAGLFDLVVVVRFLDRALYQDLHRLLAVGGELLLSTATEDWPGNRSGQRYRLRRGELSKGLFGLEVIEVEEQDGIAGLHARKSG